MKALTTTLFLIFLSAPYVAAQDKNIEILAEDLGKLEQKTSMINRIEQYSGANLLASVVALPGRSYTLNAPMNIQRLEYLVPKGTPLAKGDPFVRIIGPEVHHYHAQYEIYEQLFKQSEALYKSNKALFKNRAINEKSWLEIAERYFKIKMIYDEYTHFFEYVLSVDEQSDAIVIGAPIAGLVSYSDPTAVMQEDLIARFTPKDAIRLKVSLPVDSQQTLLSISNEICDLPIDSISEQAASFYKVAYSGAFSAALGNECNLTLGEQSVVVPKYKMEAFEVNSQAVFNWEGSQYLFVKNKNRYTAEPVEIIASSDGQYIVSSNSLLTNKEVLVTSVSAAQGILMGLGE